MTVLVGICCPNTKTVGSNLLGKTMCVVFTEEKPQYQEHFITVSLSHFYNKHEIDIT